jgi:hypothetical protein
MLKGDTITIEKYTLREGAGESCHVMINQKYKLIHREYESKDVYGGCGKSLVL